MTPEEIVTALVSAASKSDADKDSIVAGIETAGSTFEEATTAYNFIQVAWGRCFLDGMGITFSDRYYLFNGDGDLCESGNLADREIYAHAVSVAESHKGSAAFELMAFTSAEMNSVNAALNGGSKPENLVTTPACFFLSQPTESAVEKVGRMLEEEMRRNAPAAPRKPWWKFWK